MAQPVPRSLHRITLRLAHGVRLAWWWVVRPELHGCNALVGNGRGEVLLVRHSYQAPDRWMLPGGGIARGERPEDAAIREVAEETGCRLRDAHCFGVDIAPLAGARNHVHLVSGRTDDRPQADGRELLEARFFNPDALPPTIAGAARRRIAWWRGRASEQR